MSATELLIATAATAAIKYLRADQSRSYALVERASVRIEGAGAGAFNFDDGSFRIYSPSPDVCVLTCEPFGADSGNWNGPDLLSDFKDLQAFETRTDGAFEASLYHDQIFKRAREIARANGVAEQTVLKWANGVMNAVQAAYAKEPTKGGWWRRVVYGVLEIGRPVYHPVKRFVKWLFALAAAVLLGAGCDGCFAPPDWTATPLDGGAIVWELDGHVGTNAPPSDAGWFGEGMADDDVRAMIAAPGL